LSLLRWAPYCAGDALQGFAFAVVFVLSHYCIPLRTTGDGRQESTLNITIWSRFVALRSLYTFYREKSNKEYEPQTQSPQTHFQTTSSARIKCLLVSNASKCNNQVKFKKLVTQRLTEKRFFEDYSKLKETTPIFDNG
jgi:hypothetical protein